MLSHRILHCYAGIVILISGRKILQHNMLGNFYNIWIQVGGLSDSRTQQFTTRLILVILL